MQYKLKKNKMKKITIKIITLASLFLILVSCAQQEEINMDWPQYDNVAKPWTRWWWQGNAVTKEGITAELEAYSEAGFGGVELTPIYGVIGEENANIEYLSSPWVDMLMFTLEEAERLGMGVDMATGTGWPFGGPWVHNEDACKYLAHQSYTLRGGESLDQKVVFTQQPILRNVPNAMLQIYQSYGKDMQQVQKKLQDPDFKFDFERLTFNDVVNPVWENTNLQDLALDQVRFEENISLITLMAFEDSGEKKDLTDLVKENGSLDWIAPPGNWTLHAIFQGLHGKMVERAAPGGEGNVIDHFSATAIDNYLQKFDEAFEGRDIASLRAFFNDSYEVDDAQGQSNWTPEFLDKFYAKKGYALTDYLDILFGADTSVIHQRVLSDVREVFSDLLLETFTHEWGEWAYGKDAVIRNQAHGSPSNILDLYAASDIPETEGQDIIRAKFATSAGNVSGKQLISSESATWLDEHFQSNLGDLKENVDRYFVSGVNHIFYHGTAYSPPGEPWPGRLFYAAIHANPRNTLWHDFPVFNQYVTRVQSVLQKGRPDNDILLYFPAYDRFATPERELLSHFDAHGPELDHMPFKATADLLLAQGYAFDFISDRQIQQLVSTDHHLKSGEINYSTLIVPKTEYLPLNTMQKLSELAEAGATIIFVDELPVDVPGMEDLENRKEAMLVLKEGFQFERNTEGMMEASIGNGKAIKGSDVVKMLQSIGIERERMSDSGLHFTRRIIDQEEFYFISNWSENDIDGWIPLSRKGQAISIMDPMTGIIGIAKLKQNDKHTDVYLQIPRGGSVLLRFLPDQQKEPEWNYYKKTQEVVQLDKNWNISFLEGGPDLPSDITNTTLQPWTSYPENDYTVFSGTARYSTTFSNSNTPSLGFLLDLGIVNESAEVRINDTYVGTLVGPEYQLFIDQSLIKDINKLDILVTNGMANRIIDMEKNNIFWKKFYNTNFPPRTRENMGKYRIFDASGWEPKTSGITGPVTLTRVEKLD